MDGSFVGDVEGDVVGRFVGAVVKMTGLMLLIFNGPVIVSLIERVAMPSRKRLPDGVAVKEVESSRMV